MQPKPRGVTKKSPLRQRSTSPGPTTPSRSHENPRPLVFPHCPDNGTQNFQTSPHLRDFSLLSSAFDFVAFCREAFPEQRSSLVGVCLNSRYGIPPRSSADPSPSLSLAPLMREDRSYGIESRHLRNRCGYCIEGAETMGRPVGWSIKHAANLILSPAVFFSTDAHPFEKLPPGTHSFGVWYLFRGSTTACYAASWLAATVETHSAYSHDRCLGSPKHALMSWMPPKKSISCGD